MIQEHGAETVQANLKNWLTETSELGCGDDITVVDGVFYRRVRESQEMIVDRYYYHQLNKQEQAIYKAFYKGVMSHQEIIPIPVRGEFSQESSERIFMAMTRDNPLIYFLNQSACSTASDMFGRLAICPQYFFTKEKDKRI